MSQDDLCIDCGKTLKEAVEHMADLGPLNAIIQRRVVRCLPCAWASHVKEWRTVKQPFRSPFPRTTVKGLPPTCFITHYEESVGEEP